ncbi:MAG TPA: hypothetical protein VF848_12000 [Steroidobacteraceae bacterium]
MLTVRFTADPLATLVPAVGFWLMTSPAATVALLVIVTVPSVSPAPVIAAVAAAWVSPTTFGTLTDVGPVLTVRFTADPLATLVPAVGFWLMTSPAASVALLAIVTVPRFRPAPVIAVVAAAWVSPTTFGTLTDAGPLLTVRFTAAPLATLVPAAGIWLMTLPAATVALLAIVTVPSVSPAPVIAVVAIAWVSPTTFGTVTAMAPELLLQLEQLVSARLNAIIQTVRARLLRLSPSAAIAHLDGRMLVGA